MTLEKYQIEKRKAEEDEIKKARENIMKEIEEELNLLNKNFENMGKLEFLKFVYATHPPKNTAHKLKEVSAVFSFILGVEIIQI